MKFKTRTLAAALVASTATGALAPAWADGGAAVAGLFGGMVLGNALRSSRDAERERAYQSGYASGAYSAAPPPPPRTVVVERPAGGQGSAEQRIAELNDLHSKGLITDAEYASRKKAILDSL